jgi:hypothetical protein
MCVVVKIARLATKFTMTRLIRTYHDEFISDPFLIEKGFSDAARRLFDHVKLRSVSRNLFGVVPPLIVLWSMLRWEPKLGTCIIKQCDVDLWALEKDVEFALQIMSLTDEDVARRCQTKDGLYFDYSMVGALATSAVLEATELSDGFISTEHVALALGNERSDAPVLEILCKHRVSYNQMRQNLIELR